MAMLDGTIGVLLKSLGIDPQELARVAGEAQRIVQSFDETMRRIEAKQDAILRHLGADEYERSISNPRDNLKRGNGDIPRIDHIDSGA